jgi:hypothetical protein
MMPARRCCYRARAILGKTHKYRAKNARNVDAAQSRAYVSHGVPTRLRGKAHTTSQTKINNPTPSRQIKSNHESNAVSTQTHNNHNNNKTSATATKATSTANTNTNTHTNTKYACDTR